MNIDLKAIPTVILPRLLLLRRYMRFIFFIFVLLLCSFLVFQINRLSNIEPSEDEIAEKLGTVQRPRIDQNSLTKIQQLQDQNIEVKALFKDARDNPFSE